MHLDPFSILVFPSIRAFIPTVSVWWLSFYFVFRRSLIRHSARWPAILT